MTISVIRLRRSGLSTSVMFLRGLFLGRPAELPEDRASLPLHGVARSRRAGDDPVTCSVRENCERLHRQGVRIRPYCGPLQVSLNATIKFIHA